MSYFIILLSNRGLEKRVGELIFWGKIRRQTGLNGAIALTQPTPWIVRHFGRNGSRAVCAFGV
jgi:hypothetical protein